MKVRLVLQYFFIALLLQTIQFPKLWGQHNVQSKILIQGEIPQPLSLSIEDLEAMSPVLINVTQNGRQLKYRGVDLQEVLKIAGLPQGEHLRGENLVKYLIAKAADGYEVLFSLAEIDTVFSNKKIYVAFELDGEPLPIGTGPFRLVIPDEARQARWIRELRSLHIEIHK